MIIRVLGSAAGGGFPQWNCNCGNCAAVRAGSAHVHARTQTSIAVSSDGLSWTLLDASPDLRAQIGATPALQPRSNDARRSSPIKAVVVTGIEVDQVGGLLNLREGQQFRLHATAFVQGSLRSNDIFGALSDSAVTRCTMTPGRPFEPFAGAQIDILPLSVAGKIPLHNADRREQQGDETVGLLVRDSMSGKHAAYIPSCAVVTDALQSHLASMDVVFFDGTVFTDDELVEQGLSEKTGAMMGHIAMSGPRGAIENLRDVAIARRIFIHLNNSNPVLRDDSRERNTVVSAGWDVAYDGMEIRL